MGLRVGYDLKRAQHALRAATDAVAREHGLTTSQYSTLDAIGRNPGLHGAALARACFVTPQTMDDLLKRLEETGLVSRANDPSHGRRLSYSLTASGRRALDAMTDAMEAVQVRMVSGLTPEGVEELARYLRSCAEALETAD
jgi:DNA-binding MarR family transcriptional regulator